MERIVSSFSLLFPVSIQVGCHCYQLVTKQKNYGSVFLFLFWFLFLFLYLLLFFSYFFLLFYPFVNGKDCFCRQVAALPFVFEPILRLSDAFVSLFDVLTKAVGPIVSIHWTLLLIHFLFFFGVL